MIYKCQPLHMFPAVFGALSLLYTGSLDRGRDLVRFRRIVLRNEFETQWRPLARLASGAAFRQRVDIMTNKALKPARHFVSGVQ